ncbi:unnamed protein product [Amoebophrya sp. A25]|nr:unnamed protein product [Amoebophrya sp. A25]|eukprot:GSA25T00025234001.1
MSSMLSSGSSENRLGFEERRREFKKGQDEGEIRRKREDDEVQLRKSEKADLLAKKRQHLVTGNEADSTTSGAGATSTGDVMGLPTPSSSSSSSSIRDISKDTPISELAEIVLSDKVSDEGLLAPVTEIRKRLSRTDNPPINGVIQCGIVPRMISIMASTTSHSLKFELAWALTNVASGNCDQTRAVVDAGGLQAFLGILNSRSALKAQLCEQCVWALGNIAGDGPELRDVLLRENVMRILQNICTAVTSLPWSSKEAADVLRNVMWLMSNLCRGRPPAPFEVVKPAFEVFAEVVGRNMDKDMTVDSMWGLSYLTNTGNAEDDNRRCLQMLLVSQNSTIEIDEHSPNLLVKCLLNILRYGAAAGTATDDGPVKSLDDQELHKDDNLMQTPALRILGNIVSASDSQLTSVCIASGIIGGLVFVITKLPPARTAAKLRKEAVWILSNIAAGTKEQIRRLFDPVEDVLSPARPATSSGDLDIEAGGMMVNGGDDEESSVPVKPRTRDTFDVLMKELRTATTRPIKAECAWAFANAISVHGEFIDYLVVKKRVFEAFAERIQEENDVKLINILLDAIINALKYSDSTNRNYLTLAEETGLHKALHRVVNDFSAAQGDAGAVCKKASDILDRWWSAEDDLKLEGEVTKAASFRVDGVEDDDLGSFGSNCRAHFSFGA